MFGKSKLEIRVEWLEKELKDLREEKWRIVDRLDRVLDYLGLREEKVYEHYRLVKSGQERNQG